jgi:hypothetical protein
MIHEKTLSKKSRDTVLLSTFETLFPVYVFKVDKGVLQCWALGGCQADRLLRVWCNWRRNQSNPPPAVNNESLVVRDYKNNYAQSQRVIFLYLVGT